MDLSVITVTWNSKETIATQARSVLHGCKDIVYEQIIVDNASTDGTYDFLYYDFGFLKLIKNEKNFGFAAANNQGFLAAESDYILFLNPDMKCEENSLDKLVAYLEKNKEVGIVSCRLIDENGQSNLAAGPRRFPTVLNQLVIILKLHKIFPFLLNNYLMKGFDFFQEQQVDSVRGSFMMVKRELLEKLGHAFDPRYFIWFEDVDLCRESKRLGYKVVYNPVVGCVDYVGQSFKKRDFLWKQKQFTKSMLQYFQKWEPWYKWIWIWTLRPVGLFIVWLGNLL